MAANHSKQPDEPTDGQEMGRILRFEPRKGARRPRARRCRPRRSAVRRSRASTNMRAGPTTPDYRHRMRVNAAAIVVVGL